jgi:N-acetyl-anhydromuramyl-L-alanine amidase AmpD
MKFDQNGWLDVATEVDYSANSMSRQGYGIKYLVLHGTAGGSSAQGIGQYFKSTIGGSSPVSSHLIIDQQGNIVQGVPMSRAAFANGVITNGHAAYLPDPSINPNWYTASIEFVKSSTDNSDPLADIQAKVGFEVIKCICDTYHIPKRAGDANGGIISHADIDPVNRSRCPGNFPWDELFNYLNGGNQPMSSIDLTNGTVASHFSGDNTIWTCKDNGFIIGHAILDFYRKFGGDALCGLTYLGLPKTNELPVVGYPGVTIQEFERAAVRYDPGKVLDNPPGSGPVYVIHVGQDPRTIALLKQIADLQQQLNKDTQAQEIAQLQAQNDQLKTLLDASNIGKINGLAQQIEALSQVQ